MSETMEVSSQELQCRKMCIDKLLCSGSFVLLCIRAAEPCTGEVPYRRAKCIRHAVLLGLQGILFGVVTCVPCQNILLFY